MLNGSENLGLVDMELSSRTQQSRMSKVMTVGWLGQTTASLCWILSAFAYGISTTGDWMQLFAASSWMISNIAAIFSDE